MRKKYRELKRKGNVIVFPTTINRLLTDGMNYLKNENYEEARDKLYQVLSYEPENAAALGAYAYSLFELGDYEEALDVCRELLKVGPIHYLETMELYISILMQVREYKEAEQMIEILIEENVLPEERLEQFRQLRDLNERIVSSASVEDVPAAQYSLDNFLTLTPFEQERLIMDLPLESYKAMKNHLIQIVEHPNVDMLTKTYILFMLHQEKIRGTVHIQKFHFEAAFSIAALPDPLNNKRLNSVKRHLEDALAQDPTRLEMVQELFERHIYLLYPFQWEDYEPREIAEAYLSYLDLLFTGEETFTGDENLTNLIKSAEQWFEWRNG
ncbi:tetratricopeptide repeat protein [Planomicrobium sp. CPCC 101110]|uniref:tetratricopeptide repeat protein n=1 Tax=Planomicrobium sp. CPCC 101110 TaxID=2599619 RepID=UPI0011B5F425|nr:tetratricopeptide repeat protein [Planomicrobium sp. CPCC 101110]TWT26297.1 tetratricopeptide repeat protein [Planomicrobium sp. CPCC 101110]